MKILAIDPASIVTGYALGDTDPRFHLVEAGILRENPKTAAVTRILSITKDVKRLLREYRPDSVVVEVPDGKVHGRLKGKSMGGLATYGMAVGAVLSVCDESRSTLYTVGVNLWTRGQSKKTRQMRVMGEFPNYDPDKDTKDLDISDACGLLIEAHDQHTANTRIGEELARNAKRSRK